MYLHTSMFVWVMKEKEDPWEKSKVAWAEGGLSGREKQQPEGSMGNGPMGDGDEEEESMIYIQKSTHGIHQSLCMLNIKN